MPMAWHDNEIEYYKMVFLSFASRPPIPLILQSSRRILKSCTFLGFGKKRKKKIKSGEQKPKQCLEESGFW